MKRFTNAIIILLVLVLYAIPGMAHAEDYLSIQALRETTPAVWQGTYQAEKVGTVTIDVPITLPEVDTFPIVRVTVPEKWTFADTLEVLENDPPHFRIGSHYSDNLARGRMANWRESGSGIHPVWQTGEEALDAMQRLFYASSPDFAGITLEATGFCFYQYEGQNDGTWLGNFYQTFHGIPYLRPLYFSSPSSGKFYEKWPFVSALTFTTLYREDTYLLNGGLYQEIAVEAEDVPLLSWDAIRGSIEQKIQQGYVKEITEVRLGYTAIIDANKPREFLLVPCWFVRGDIRHALHFQFNRPEELEGVVKEIAYMHFSNGAVFMFPAQTGEFIDYLGDNRRDEARYTLPILRWDDIH